MHEGGLWLLGRRWRSSWSVLLARLGHVIELLLVLLLSSQPWGGNNTTSALEHVALVCLWRLVLRLLAERLLLTHGSLRIRKVDLLLALHRLRCGERHALTRHLALAKVSALCTLQNHAWHDLATCRSWLHEARGASSAQVHAHQRLIEPHLVILILGLASERRLLAMRTLELAASRLRHHLCRVLLTKHRSPAKFVQVLHPAQGHRICGRGLLLM